jgi:hypothetical protein
MCRDGVSKVVYFLLLEERERERERERDFEFTTNLDMSLVSPFWDLLSRGNSGLYLNPANF